MSETHGNPSDHHHAPAALPEPKTPMWLPALGLVLFLVAGLLWGLSPEKNEAGTGAGTGADAGAAGAAHPH
jgi:hypothetical protein